METAFFAVSKLVWFVIRPESLLFLSVAGSLLALLLHRRKTALWLGGFSLAAMVLIFAYPVARPLYAPLERQFAARPVVEAPVGIIVLGGGEDHVPPLGRGTPSVNDAGERYLAAIALARQYPDAWVMFTGGRASLRGGPAGNAAQSAEIFVSGGIARDRIVLEDSSRTTAENASKGLALRPSGTEDGPWLLVTSAWHMPRAVGTLCAAGWSGLVPWPSDFRSGRLYPNWSFANNLSELNGATKEWVGLLGYRLAGRTAELMPKGCPPN
ncbi:MAG: YdcF family protein [Pseudomonadota bacterium]